MLGWILFGVTLFFLIAVSIYANRLDEELNSEPNPEYLDSLGKYRQTVVNEVLTYIQVWMAWDEPPSLDTNTFADVFSNFPLDTVISSFCEVITFPFLLFCTIILLFFLTVKIKKY